MLTPTYTKELELLRDYRLIAGVDEVGRGPLAGPVVSAAVILNPDKVGKYRSKWKWWSDIRDSKTVPRYKREALAEFITENALDHAVGLATHREIDELNVHYASLLSMKRAVEKLRIIPEIVLVDGKFGIPLLQFLPTRGGGTVGGIIQKTIVDGDARVLSIAAASILAKVHRDHLMRNYAEQFPEYGFEKHNGYNTLFHRKQIFSHGPCVIHRMSFPALQNILGARFAALV